MLMFPIVVRSADEILRLVPNAQKEAALALGAPAGARPGAWSSRRPRPGLLTGRDARVWRAPSGETAPLLFTSLGNQFLLHRTSSSRSPRCRSSSSQLDQRADAPVRCELAWGAALVLVAIILVLNIVARLIASRVRPLEGR